MRNGMLPLAVLAAGLAPMMASAQNYRAGVARVVITPTEPTWAGGYGSRTHTTSEKEMDLYAKALALDDGKGGRVLIITTDLLGLPKNIADPVAQAIMDKHHLKREQIVLSSSHTHSGPVLRESLVDIYPMSPADWDAVHRYTKRLNGQLVDLAGEALAHMEPVTLSQGVGECGFAVNRRTNSEKDVVPGYVPKGPTDHEAPVLKVSTPDGKLKAVLFGYACHNTVMDYYKWSGDYAGFAQAAIEAEHPGVTALFFEGCGADQNPLPRRKVELARKYGKELATSVDAVLAKGTKPVEGPLSCMLKYVDLPLAEVPDRAGLEKLRDSGNRQQKPLAKRLLAGLDAGMPVPTTYPYPVQAIQFGKDVTLIVLAGEVVVDYSIRLKRELGAGRTWVAGYCNDVFAYIPSKRVLTEGGYEGFLAMPIYGLPGKWAPEVEEMIVKAAHGVADTVRATEK
jgi:neutral ceramidase